MNELVKEVASRLLFTQTGHKYFRELWTGFSDEQKQEYLNALVESKEL